MQHVVRNRATMRVADRTEVSGRVTADEVNLDRFHNRIREVCASVFTLIPSSLRWMLLFTVPIVPQVLWAAGAPVTPQTWFATVGAQSNDKGRQALAFLPNEIWIHAGDSITWRFEADEAHTVTFIPDRETRPFFEGVAGSPSGSQFPDPKLPGTTVVSSPGQVQGPNLPFVKGATFTVNFPTTGNFKQVCLFHQNMTAVVHVLEASQELPHDQDFYDRQAADQRRDLLSDRDGVLVAGCQQHGECAAQDSLTARVVTAGIGEISATAGGTQTLSVVRFLGDKIVIRAGDTVEWTNHDPVTPHTVTFGIEPAIIFNPTANLTVDADGALHGVVSSPADNVSSGVIGAAAQDTLAGNPQTPLGLTRFRLTFPNPGVFPYKCALHDTLGMTGTVIVH
jgi:plastocyanin